MKYKNSEICHVWANQSVSNGSNYNDTIYFEGPKIYSYGSHYLAANMLPGTKIILMNCASYSNTTAGHMAKIRQAINYRHFTVINVPQPDIKPGKNESNKENIEYLFLQLQNNAYQGKKARTKQSDYFSNVEYYKDIIIQYCEDLNCKSLLTKSMKSVLDSPIEEVSEKYTIMIDNRRAKEKAKQNRLEKAAVKKWLTFKSNSTANINKVYLRLKDDTIETSMNVKVSASECRLLWPLIQDCKENKKLWKSNGQQFKIGYYRIEKIDQAGKLFAGCHTIEFDILQDMAKQLNLI